MARNKLCWDASYAMELSKQKKVGVEWYEQLASQHKFIPYHMTGSCKGPICLHLLTWYLSLLELFSPNSDN